MKNHREISEYHHRLKTDNRPTKCRTDQKILRIFSWNKLNITKFITNHAFKRAVILKIQHKLSYNVLSLTENLASNRRHSNQPGRNLVTRYRHLSDLRYICDLCTEIPNNIIYYI